MYLPVTMPPAAAALMAKAALGDARKNHWFTRLWLGLPASWAWPVPDSIFTACRAPWAAGATGARTRLDGPPIPAPPSFTGLALAGLAALALLRAHPDD